MGYIGPNGAGKSTTIKMLTGILVPSGGSIRVAGVDPSRHRLKLAKRIGVVFGQRTTLWWDLPLKDSFAVLQKMYDVPAPGTRENLATFIELLDLGDLLDVPVRQLSWVSGCAATSRPPCCTTPRSSIWTSRRSAWTSSARPGCASSWPRSTRNGRTTVILTTHDLDDIEALCPRVMVIDHGRQISTARSTASAPANPLPAPW